jgi:predicted permease
MLNDLRYAFRTLSSSPGLAISAIVALALGIGANTAVFSVVYAVLLKPLPYSEPERLVRLSERNPAQPGREAVVSAGTFVDWRTRSRALAGLAVYAPLFANGETVWNIGERAQIVKTAGVSSSLFAVLRVQPILGRGLRPEDESVPPGARGQFVISYGLWQRAFGGAADIVGRPVDLEGRLPREIVGVMPPGFDFPDGTEAWTSVPLPKVDVPQRRARSFEAIGRLAAGVTIDDLRRELGGISTQLAVEYPASNAGWVPDVAPASNSHAASARLALTVLMAAVAGVLLIGCANVANLLLARGAMRRVEMRVRLALGASPSRLIRHSAAEAAILCVTATAAGLALGVWLDRVLIALAPMDIAASGGGGLNGAVLGFAVAASSMCLGIAGVMPAIAASREAHRGGLRPDLRAVTAHGAALRRWAIGGEVAIVVLLLTTALLFLRTFGNLRRADLGFQTDRTLAVETRWPVGYLMRASPGTRPWPLVQRAVDGLIGTVEGVPGVIAAGLITEIPLTSDPYGGTMWRADAPGATTERPPDDPRYRWRADLSIVTPGYFPAMSIAFLRGRNFEATDRYSDEQLAHPGGAQTGSVIVNSSFASMYFPGVDPVGRSIVLADDQEFGPTRTIVGVVSDARQRSVWEAPRPTVFIPHAQHPDMIRPSLVVRTSLPVASVAPLIRERLTAFDPQLVVLGIRPMADIVSGALTRPRFNLLLVGSFAVLGLVLAAVGIYGVVAFLVTQRTREIGIRMALGARAADVLRLVLAEGMTPVAIGAAAGLLAAIAVTRTLRSMLFGISPLDAVSFTAAPALLALVALAACYVPASRATRVDPLVALRDE